MKVVLNKTDVDSLAPLTRRPNNYDDYQISFSWTKSVLSVLATATLGTVLSYKSVEEFDEDVAKAIRAELHALAWMSLAVVGEDHSNPAESVRIQWVIEKLSTPLVRENQFPTLTRNTVITYPGDSWGGLQAQVESVLSEVNKDYLLYPMLSKAVLEMLKQQNLFSVYPVLREQIKALFSQRVTFLQTQGL